MTPFTKGDAVESQTKPMSDPTPSGKALYHKPELAVWGDVRKLTFGNKLVPNGDNSHNNPSA
jgi:hypothetical protein